MQFGVLRPHQYTARKPRASTLRRKQIRTGAFVGVGALLFIWLLVHLFSGGSSRSKAEPQKKRVPPGTPEVVIVTVFEGDENERYVSKIKENRDDYARRHNYKNFYANSTEYDIGVNTPPSWAIVPALRHAMTLYPHTTYFFSLSPHSLFMNPSLSVTSHVMDTPRLESLMLKDKPVVPPDSVIHTFSHLKGDKIDLVLTQDEEGLCQESFILRQGDWAKFFLDVWFDPLYRSYNFQKAEGHALEHIVQWHPTILTKLALIPIRTINSYTVEIPTRGGMSVTYQEEDFVVRAVGCEKDINRECEREMDPWYFRWRELYGSSTKKAADPASPANANGNGAKKAPPRENANAPPGGAGGPMA